MGKVNQDVDHGKITPLVCGLLVRDKYGDYHVVDISVRTRIIADVYVFFKNPTKRKTGSLCEDKSIRTYVHNFLSLLGYEGPALDRAELGMQGPKYIVLEPTKEFTDFAKKRYGFKE